MGLLSRIFGSRQSQSDLANTELIGVCPNCWGYQNYDNQFVENNNVFTNRNNQKAFVLRFVEKYITGIK